MLGNNKEVSVEKYISNHHIDFYFEDAVKQMLVCKSDNFKIKPDFFLHQYFLSLKHGTHTLFREYEFIRATPWNRASFIKTIWLSFHRFQTEGESLRATDYCSLISLLCPDFPNEHIEKAAKIVLPTPQNAIEEEFGISFSDFMCAFQFQFYYDEFIRKCEELFQSCLLRSSTSSSKSQKHRSIELKSSIKPAHFSEAVAMDIFNNKRTNYTLPSEDIVARIIQSNSCVTLHGFLSQLSRDNEIYNTIGALKDAHFSEGYASF